MKKYIIPFLALICIIACTTEKRKPTKDIQFTGNVIYVDYDTTITSIAYYKGFILAVQENGKLLVIDSSFQRRIDLETPFNNIKIESLTTRHDTVMVYSGDKSYYLDSGLSIKKYTGSNYFFHDPLYEDKTWYVHGCCVGEFGGSVFFVERLTKITWSYPATCAAQVIRYKDAYWVCENLAHLGRRTDYTLIPDIKSTYKLTANNSKRHCNWWTIVDSLRDFWKMPKQNGIKFIEGPMSSMTALNFVYDDSLYTVVANDTATYINVLRNDSLAIQDTLFKHPLNFHWAKTLPTTSGSVTLLSLTSGSPFAAYFYTGNSSVMLVRNGRNFNLLVKNPRKGR